MYKRSVLILSLITLSLFINSAFSQVVCSQDELVRELYEDIIDNGSL